MGGRQQTALHLLLYVLCIMPELKQCLKGAIIAVFVCKCGSFYTIAGCTGQTGKRMRSMTALGG